jgi:hypothetical protein
LERSSAESGPWKAIAVDERRSNDLVAVLDREVDLTRVHFYRLVAELPNGLHATFGPITSAGSVRSVGITSILPNPAMNRFRIDYDVEQPEDVRILIMDVAGRRVKELIHDRLAPGRYSVTWDAHRERVAAGVYFLHWESPGHITNQRLVLLQ